MAAVQSTPSNVNVGHKPVISAAKQEDAVEALCLWFPHFGVKVPCQLATGIPASVFADHPGSRNYRIASLASVFASLVLFPLSYSLALIALVVAFPFLILFFRHAYMAGPNSIRLYVALNREKSNASHRFWMARCHCSECRGQLVGMIGAQKRDSQNLELQRLIVRPKVRRLGLARQLSQNAIDFGIERGCTRVVLRTLATSHGAINLYTQQGFRKVKSVSYPSPILASLTQFISYAKDL